MVSTQRPTDWKTFFDKGAGTMSREHKDVFIEWVNFTKFLKQQTPKMEKEKLYFSHYCFCLLLKECKNVFTIILKKCDSMRVRLKLSLTVLNNLSGLPLTFQIWFETQATLTSLTKKTYRSFRARTWTSRSPQVLNNKNALVRENRQLSKRKIIKQELVLF